MPRPCCRSPMRQETSAKSPFIGGTTMGKYFGWTTKYGTSTSSAFIRSGQFVVKPAINEAARALKKTRLPRQRELPLAKTAHPTGTGSQPTNNLPARKVDRTRLQIKAPARGSFARDGILNSSTVEILKQALGS